jgi:RNA polymerase sigma-70 factor (ECF subfamily)
MRKDEQSFEALAVPHMQAIYRIARRLSGDQHEAEDLVQETYLKAHKAFARFELRKFGIRPWLLKILHNTFLNRHARLSRAPKAADQRALDQQHEGAELSSGPPELDYEQLDGEVRRAIEALAPDFRTVILLWATMEHSYQEIADIIGAPIGTVMSRLHRARQQLMSALEDYARSNRLTTKDAS